VPFTPNALTPLLSVFDMIASARFYRDLLGFQVVSASPEVDTKEGRFSHWMLLKRGSAELMLNTQYDSNERPAERDVARGAAHGDTVLYIACNDIDEAYRELSRGGLPAAPPQQAHGLRQFICKDPDGYLIVFQEPPRP
jgi:catechol 2,3-dioxygenase-like lactoylglutathione lyase family enzyme